MWGAVGAVRSRKVPQGRFYPPPKVLTRDWSSNGHCHALSTDRGSGDVTAVRRFLANCNAPTPADLLRLQGWNQFDGAKITGIIFRHVTNHVVPRTPQLASQPIWDLPPLLELFSSFSSTPSSSLPSTSLLPFSLSIALNPSLADLLDAYPSQVNVPRLMTAATVLVFRSGDVHDPNSAITQPVYGTRTHKTGFPKDDSPPSRPSETHTHAPLRKLKLVSSNVKVAPSSSQEIATAPVFPPPGVMLHSEDATNKVLKAIGRSFLSVVCSFPCAHVPHHLLLFWVRTIAR